MRFSQTSRRRGFTLVELLMAMTISSFVLAAATGAILAMAKGSQSLVNYTEMNIQSRHALDNLGTYLRSASDVHTASEDELVFERLDESGATETLRYHFDATAGTLTLLRAGQSDVILRDVSELAFNYYTLRQDATTNPLEVKHVQLEAELRRRVLAGTNRNYIISARFMLRNRRVNN